MPLHHQRPIDDIRQAYAADVLSSRLAPERHASGSERSSYCTAQSEYSLSASPKYAPTSVPRSYQLDMPPRYFEQQLQASPKASFETYASTVSDDEAAEADDEPPEYDVPDLEPTDNTAIAATPSDFSQLFPSRKRLTIRHDDSTLDGNMNLRVDTEALSHGLRCNVTLFHLRMHNLKAREFSLRRYCRDSGREVCHSSTRARYPTFEKRPGFQRSLTNAFSSIRHKSDSKSPTLSSLTRHDSGIGSMHSVGSDANARPRSAGFDTKGQQSHSVNTIKLEFSNYAQVDIKRSGVQGGKRYEFSYWGIQYNWKRIVRKSLGPKQVAFHLHRSGGDDVVAFVAPIALSEQEAAEERGKGGWVPPCSFWIADEHIVRHKDVADVVVATGLMALVDDSIRARFTSKQSSQLLIPLPKTNASIDYVGPKRLINELFRRDSSSSNPASRPSTAKQMTC